MIGPLKRTNLAAVLKSGSDPKQIQSLYYTVAAHDPPCEVPIRIMGVHLGIELVGARLISETLRRV